MALKNLGKGIGSDFTAIQSDIIFELKKLAKRVEELEKQNKELKELINQLTK